MTNTLPTTLSKIQKDLKAPKDKTGQGIRYSYRSCEQILEAVKPLLPENVFILLADEIVQVGDRHYVKATATISNGTETFYSSAYAREPLSMASINESQVTGSSSSYARKYALSGLLAIDDNKDADALSADGTINSPSTPKTAPVVINESLGLCPKCGAKNARSKSTGSIYCSDMCWKTPERQTLSQAGLETDTIPF